MGNLAGAPGALTLAEMREFASFSAATQRYIRRSLDVGLERSDAEDIWARDVVEAANIRAQRKVYADLQNVRENVPDNCGLDELDPMLSILVSIAAFDLAQGRLTNFPAFRFLYERLIGPEVRPFLPAAFCAAAALPHLHPRKRKQLLQSISEAAATAPGWSDRAPSFFPEWVEKIDPSNTPEKPHH